MFACVTDSQLFSQTSRSVKIPTDARLGSLVDLVATNFADSFCYPFEHQQLPPLRNRFITWRSVQNEVQFEEHSLDHNLLHNAVTLHFGHTTVLPGTSVAISHDQLTILVPTLHYAFRFVLPEPSALIQQQQQDATRRQRSANRSMVPFVDSESGEFSSILAHFLKWIDVRTHHELVNDRACAGSAAVNGGASGQSTTTTPIQCTSCVVDTQQRAVFAYGYADGTVLVITMPPQHTSKGSAMSSHSYTDSPSRSPTGDVRHQLIQPHSALRRFLKYSTFGMLSSDSGGNNVAHEAALTSTWHAHSDGVAVLITITRDSKLNMWSTKTRDFTQSTDLTPHLASWPHESSSVAEPTLDSAVVKTCKLDDLLLVVVVVTRDGHSQLVLLTPTKEFTNLVRVTARMLPSQFVLTDFTLTTEHVWLLGAHAETHDTMMFHADVDVAKQGALESWCPVLSPIMPIEPEPTDRACASSDDIPMSEQYLNAILESFSTETVWRALKVTFNVNPESIAGAAGGNVRLADVMRGSIAQQMRNTSMNTSSKRNTSLLETQTSECELKLWKSLWSSCLQYHTSASQPLSLINCQPIDLFGVVMNKQMSFFVPIGAPMLDTSLTGYFMHTDSCPNIDFHAICDSITQLYNSNVTVEQRHELEQPIADCTSDSDGEQVLRLATQLCASIVQDARQNPDLENILTSLHTQLRVIGEDTMLSWLDTISQDVEFVGADFDRLLAENQGDVVPHTEYTSCLSSRVGAGALSAAVTRRIQHKIHQSRGALLVVAFMASDGTMQDPTSMSSTESRSRLEQHITQRICPALRQLFLADSVTRLSVTSSVGDQERCRLVYTLLTSARQESADMLRRLMAARVVLTGSDDCSVPLIWSNVIDEYINVLMGACWPYTHAMVLPSFLDQHRHDQALLHYCELLSTDNSHTATQLVMKYYEAVALAHLGKLDAAYDMFISVSDGVRERDIVLISQLFNRQQLPGFTIESLVLEYFLKIMAVFEEVGSRSHVISTAEYALQQTTDSNAPQVSVIWLIIFKHQCAQRRYADALTCILKQPDTVNARNCLRQLLLILAENTDTLPLISEMSYQNMDEHVSHLLDSQARTSDVSRTVQRDKNSELVVNYYQVLYSFHLKRSRYVKAAACMYEYACRLSRECLLTAAVFTAIRNALACCLQLLKMVKPDEAYLPVPNDDFMPPSNEDGTETEKSPIGDVRCALRILSPSDIRLQWLIADARAMICHFQSDEINQQLETALTAGFVTTQSSQFLLVTNQLVGALCACDCYDAAVLLACAVDEARFSSDHRYTAEVLRRLTHRAVFLSINSSLNRSHAPRLCDANTMWLHETSPVTQHDVADTGRDTSTTPPSLMVSDERADTFAWRLVQSYLAHFQNQCNPSIAHFYRVVVERCLALNHAVPSWLSAKHKQLDIAEHVRLLAEYGHVTDAIRVVIDYVNAARCGDQAARFGITETTLKPGVVGSSWLPYSIIDELFVLVQMEQTNDTIEAANELESLLSKYFNEAKRCRV